MGQKAALQDLVCLWLYGQFLAASRPHFVVTIGSLYLTEIRIGFTTTATTKLITSGNFLPNCYIAEHIGEESVVTTFFVRNLKFWQRRYHQTDCIFVSTFSFTDLWSHQLSSHQDSNYRKLRLSCNFSKMQVSPDQWKVDLLHLDWSLRNSNTFKSPTSLCCILLQCGWCSTPYTSSCKNR